MLRTLLAACAAVAIADVKVSRTINTLAPGITFNLTVAGPGSPCGAVDSHGCGTFDLLWGTNYTASLDLVTLPINAGSKIIVTATIEDVIHFNVSCAACGANCSFTVPIINKDVNFALPACPIAAINLLKALPFKMPAKSPVPVSVQINKAKLQVLDPSANVVVDADLTGSLSPTELEYATTMFFESPW
jgi:hypothetical protein